MKMVFDMEAWMNSIFEQVIEQKAMFEEEYECKPRYVAVSKPTYAAMVICLKNMGTLAEKNINYNQLALDTLCGLKVCISPIMDDNEVCVF